MSTTNNVRDMLYGHLRIFLTVALISFWLGSGVFSVSLAQGFSYVTWEPGINPPTTALGDCTNHYIPDLPFPTNKLDSYMDPIFHTRVTRFTDWENEHGSRHMNIQYTTFSCGNSDNTMVAFGNGTTSNIFYDSKTGAYLRNDSDMYYVRFSYKADDEFRWSHDPMKPNIGYFRDKWYFCEYDYSKTPGNRVTLIRDFQSDYPDSTFIDNNDKGEQSWDDRYWAFRVNTGNYGSHNVSHIICYDRIEDKIYECNMSQYYEERGWSERAPAARWVTMSPSGKYVIVKLYAPVGQSNIVTTLLERSGESGLVAVKDGNNYRDLRYGLDTGHPAWGYDAEGNEVFVYCNSLPTFRMVELDTGTVTDIFNNRNDCADCDHTMLYGGTHVSSCYNRALDGWFFYTNYYTDNPDNPYQTHQWLERELFAVRFSKNQSKVKVWRICHTHIKTGDYYNQGRAQVSQDGKFVYFDSNFMGLGPGLPTDEAAEIFRAELPDNWWNEIDNAGPVVVTPSSPIGLKVKGGLP